MYIYRKRIYQKTFASNTTCQQIQYCSVNTTIGHLSLCNGEQGMRFRISRVCFNVQACTISQTKCIFQVRRCNTYTYLNTHEHAQTTPHNRKPTKSNSRGGRSLTNIKGNPCYMIGLTPVIKTCDKPSAPLSASPTSPEPISRF